VAYTSKQTHTRRFWGTRHQQKTFIRMTYRVLKGKYWLQEIILVCVGIFSYCLLPERLEKNISNL